MAAHDVNCHCEYCEFLRDPDRDDGPLETLPQACNAMGGVSHMFVRRRIRDARFKFPEIVRLGRRVFIHRNHRIWWMRSPHAQLTTSFNQTGEAA